MRKTAIVLFLLLSIFTLSPASAQTDKRSLIWDRWDVHIDQIDLDTNRYHVTETQVIDFDGTFRGGELAISTERLISIDEVTVQQNGTPLTRTTCRNIDDYPPPGHFCTLTFYREFIISYEFFAPVISQTQTLTFDYTVNGALRVYPDGDQLWWTAVNSDRIGVVRQSTITVIMPDGYAPREGVDPIGVYGTPGDIGVQGNTVTAVTTDAVRIGEEFSLRIQYPHNPSTPKPSWQGPFDTQQARVQAIQEAAERRAAERAYFEANILPLIDIATIAFGVLFGLGGVLVILVAYMQKGRKPSTGPVPEILTEPPVGVPPAIAGTIIDGITHVRDLLSTLIDLARRGYLVIEESKNSANNTTEYTFKRTEKSDADLDKYEQRFLSAVFTSGGERKLNSMREAFYTYIPTLEIALHQLMVDQGLIDQTAMGLRVRWLNWGRRFVMLGIVALVTGMVVKNAEEYVLNFVSVAGIVSLLNGGALLLFGSLVSNLPLTRKGAEAAAKSNAFYEYMENLEKFEAGTEAESANVTAEKFDEYLPYAIAFGFESAWMARFRHVPEQPMPTWYYPVYRGGVFSGGYQRGQPHPYTVFREMNRQGGSPIPSMGGTPSGVSGDTGKSIPGGGGFSLDDMSRGLSGGLNDISSGLSGMLNRASSALVSRPAPPPPPSWTSGGWSEESGSGFDWGSTRSRSSGYRSTNSSGSRSGGWSGSSGRSFSGGGRSGGSSGGGRSRFR